LQETALHRVLANLAEILIGATLSLAQEIKYPFGYLHLAQPAMTTYLCFQKDRHGKQREPIQTNTAICPDQEMAQKQLKQVPICKTTQPFL